MYCPIRGSGSGNKYYCWEEDCAFWDEKNKQCCIKTQMTINNQTQRVIIEKDDWGKDI
jgi:hypothetical protein